MGKLLGRDTELASIQRALDETRATNVARALRISGAPGIGKTALLVQAEDEARNAGWVIARADAHRIQSALPLAAAHRLIENLLASLGPEGSRYTAGLPMSAASARHADPAAFRETAIRLVEGVLHDFPVALAVDDAQWIDPESRALVEELLRSFSDQAIALLAAERADETSAFADIAQVIPLGPVSAQAGAALVSEYYPTAPPDVVHGILQHAAGRPFDIVALARSACETGVRDVQGLHASVGTAVAGELNHLAAPAREFLQVCSLIAEPIDYGTLLHLWPEQTVGENVAAASGKYLVQDGTALRFVHSVIAESVRQTMPVEIPYRRRIIAALAALETPTLEDYERIVQQAVACGDNALAHRTLLQLAAQAARESALFTASDAYERAFAISKPPAAELVRTYLEYASVLNMQGRLSEAAVVMQRALADTTAYNITEGTGAVAALFLVAQWGTKGYGAALEAAEPLLRRFKTRADREQLLSVTAFLHACADDRAGFERTKNELLSGGELPHEIRMRLYVAEATLCIHCGDVDAASRAAEAAVAESGSVLSANRRSAEVTRALIHFLSHGPRDIEPALPLLSIQKSSDQTQVPVVEYLRALCALARGELDRSREILHEALGRPIDRHSRVRLLGVDAALSALCGTSSPYDAQIEEILAGFSGSAGDHVALPLASWRAVSLCESNPAQARALLARVLGALERPAEHSTLMFPVALALAAAGLKDRQLLERLSTMDGIWHDRAPWLDAQRELAMGYAAKALARQNAGALLARAHDAFSVFASPLFCAFAQVWAQTPDTESAAFLSTCGIDPRLALAQPSAQPAQGQPRRKGSAVPSRREMEIIALVADGQTNRAIAEQLFLSERTVEGHIANVFNKLSVSSRTQVAAWYLTAAG